MEDPKHILKKGLEKPSVEFTKNLMQAIEAEEKSLNCFVQEHAEEKPSTDFSKNLMSQLEGMSPKKPYEPVISARIWIGITSIISTLLSIVFITSESESTSDKFSFKLYRIHFDLAGKFESNPILHYAICGILLLSIALLAEQRLKQRKGT
ncbi:MAG: hypothetical protein MK105_03855 [Crocinitomicaceae bacterium]|nr:hypothetical protein [Crocinitomicaceae bacterium]